MAARHRPKQCGWAHCRLLISASQGRCRCSLVGWLQDVTIDHALLAVGSPVVSEAGDGDGDGSNDGDRAAAGPAAAGAVPRAVPPRKQGATRTEAQKEAHKDKVAARRAVAKEKRTTNGERRGSGKQRIRLIRIEDALLRRWLVVSPDV